MDKLFTKSIKDFCNKNYLRDYEAYFVDPLMCKKNKLLSLMEKITNKDFYSEKFITDFKCISNCFLNDIAELDKSILHHIDNYDNDFLTYNPNDLNYFVNLYNEHKLWETSIKKSLAILQCSSEYELSKIPVSEAIIRLNIKNEGIRSDFPNLKIFKKYNIGNSISFIFFCKNNTFNELDLLDISILRTINTFYNNESYCISYSNVYKCLTQNNSKVVTNNQKMLVSNSINKLNSLQIIIEDHKLKKIYKENLLYLLEVSSDKFLILKVPLVFKLCELYNETISIKKNIFTCPISMTKTSLMVKEYLIYKIILLGHESGEIYFSKIYSDFNSNNPQQNSKIRYFVINILKYWKSEKILNDFDINLSDGKYISLTYYLNYKKTFV